MTKRHDSRSLQVVQNTLNIKCESYRAQKKEYRVWTRIFHRIGITLTFDPKTLFKVTANPLPISPLLVKCDSDWTEGREYIFQTNILQIGLEWPLSLTQKLSLNSLQPLYPIALYMYVVADEEWSILYIIYMQVCIFIFIAPNKYFTYKHLSIYTWNLGSRSHKPFTIRHPGGELWPDLAKSREKKMCPRQVMSAWWTDDDRWFPLGCLQRDVAFVAALTALM